MKSFSFNNYRISYSQQGTGNPLIMLHNGGNDHRIWDYQVHYLQNYFNIYTIDLLGYGQSDKPEIDYTLDMYTQLLDQFIKRHEFDHVSLMGHCIGSAISLSYALQNPDKVNYLVLMNIASIQTLSQGYLGKLYQWVLSSVTFRNSLIWSSPYIRLPRWAHRLSIGHQYGLANETDNDFLDHLIKRYQHPRQFSVLLNLLLNFHSFDYLDTVEKPEDFPQTLILWGEQNNILPVSGGRKFAENFKPDQFQILPQGGHMVMRDSFQQVNQHLVNFFNL